MKKLLIIMTLFMSSFFFICLKDAKAYEVNHTIDFSYLNENFYTFKNTVDEFIKNDTTYSDNYFIYLDGMNLKMHVVFLPLDSTYTPNVTISNNFYAVIYLFSSGTLSRFDPSSDYLSLNKSGTVSYCKDIRYYISYSSSSNFIPLYSNFPILMKEDSYNSTITYTYNNEFTSVDIANGVDNYNTLYDLYIEYQEQINNKDLIHHEELEKVGSFYNIVIEKLVYLAEIIVNNYIYLSIIVIFILIFVFLLIFRRFIC